MIILIRYNSNPILLEDYIIISDQSSICENAALFSLFDTVPDVVRHLSVTGRGSMYVHVSWEKPLRANGRLTGYLVTYQRMLFCRPLDMGLYCCHPQSGVVMFLVAYVRLCVCLSVSL